MCSIIICPSFSFSFTVSASENKKNRDLISWKVLSMNPGETRNLELLLAMLNDHSLHCFSLWARNEGVNITQTILRKINDTHPSKVMTFFISSPNSSNIFAFKSAFKYLQHLWPTKLMTSFVRRCFFAIHTLQHENAQHITRTWILFDTQIIFNDAQFV